ncbi:unnamed protein product [Mycena citricolor]|uniref:Tc1-like transposase DDE domain-containing protein n=1 Tax=Mycena citricolor TaxID=2018698 RepID=A0AAD2HXR2_9AGAR|nr:unnamed protein product [Mycena citricolor]
MQRENMYNTFKAWTDQDVFDAGVMIISDKTKMMLGSSDGRCWCRRRRGEGAMDIHQVQVEERHGKFNFKINVWGAIGPRGVSELVLIEGNLTAVQYMTILEHALIPLYNDYKSCPHSFLYFQQDNDLKHTSKLAKQWLKDNNINVFPWPAKSPDMSTIENGWAELKHRVRSHPRYNEIRTPAELFEVAKQVWNSETFCQYVIHLYKSFPCRLEQLKENNFYWINY